MTYNYAKKFVLKHYPDAICLEFNSKYQGIDTKRRVIYANFRRNFHVKELGASSECEELAWIHAVPHVKNIIQRRLLEILES